MNAALELTHTQTLYGRRNDDHRSPKASFSPRSSKFCLPQITAVKMSKQPHHYDAILIGGGPAGSSGAAMLAEYGHRVLVLEREKFPRYHIGESLIPFTFGPLERIGMIPKMKASHFVKKYSVTFVQPDGQRSQPFYFFNRYDRETVAQTWQVLRSEFDQMLLDNAREKGAEVREETTVNRLLMDGEQRRRRRGHGQDRRRTYEVRAPITLDCSGKEAFTSNRHGWRMRDPYLNKIAVWTYYKDRKREPGIDEGATTVAYVPEKGWFWHIPQHNDMVSVGVVAEGKYLTRGGVKDPKRNLPSRGRGEPLDQGPLSAGQSDRRIFHHQRIQPPLALLRRAGPAAGRRCFRLSRSGFQQRRDARAEERHAGRRSRSRGLARRRSFARAFRGLRRSHAPGVENMRKLVYAFYDPKFSFRVIDKYPEAAGEITDCLSGDVNKDFSELWEKISEFVPLPEDLPVGAPLSEPERVAQSVQ